MAYLTQYAGTVPVIKFNIDQSVMTIGQDINMDICVPEDGITDHHAVIEAVKHEDNYRFIIKSHEDEPLITLNDETVSIAELKDGDWIILGEVEFQFTDDGIYQIKQLELVIQNTPEENTPQVIQNEVIEAAPLELVQEVSQETQSTAAKNVVEDHRFSRRLNFF